MGLADIQNLAPRQVASPEPTESLSTKFLGALDTIRKKVGISDNTGIQTTDIGDAVKTLKIGTGQLAAGVGQFAQQYAPPMPGVNSLAHAIAPKQSLMDITKQRMAFTGEEMQMSKKQDQISPQIRQDIQTQNPLLKGSELEHAVNQKVAQQLFHDGIFTQRSTGAGPSFVQGVANGMSLGLFNGYASDATQMARAMQNPYSTKEQVAGIAGDLSGGLVSYGALADTVGAGLKAVPELRKMSVMHPFLFNAGLQNLGVTAAIGAVSKATGQEFGTKDFLYQMAFGAGAEGVFAGVRKLADIKLDPIQRQLNDEVKSFYAETGKLPDFQNDLWPRLENQPMAGQNMTFGEAWSTMQTSIGERRLAYLKGGQSGTPGIDHPSEPSQPPENKPPEFATQPDGQPVRVDTLTENTATKVDQLLERQSPSPRPDIVVGNRPDKITMSEPKALFYKLNAEQKGARKGFFTAARTIKDVQTDLALYIKETLPMKERGKVMVTLKNTQNKTDLGKAIARVNTVVEEMNKRDLITNINDLSHPSFLEKIPVSHQNEILKSIEPYSATNPTPKTLEIGKTVQEQLDSGTEGISRELLQKAAAARKTPLGKLTLEELQGLQDSIIDTAQRGKFEMLMSKLDSADQTQESVKAIEDGLKWWSENKSNPTGPGASARFLNMEYMTPDRFFDYLDGYKNYRGPMSGIFKAPVDTANSAYLNDLSRIGEESKALNLDKVNEESLKRIGTYGLWQRSDSGKFIGREKLSAQGVNDAPTLTAQEEAIYNFMRDQFQKLYPKIQDTLVKSENRALPGTVENYWPMMTDFNASPELRNVILDNSFNMSRNAEAGFTIKAVGGEQALQTDAAKVFSKHISDASYFIHMQPVLDRLNKIVDYRLPTGMEGAGTKSVENLLGPSATDYVKRYLNTVATNGAPAGVGSEWTRAMNILANNTTIATFAGNLSTVLKQPLSMANAAAYVDPRRLITSMAKVFFNPVNGWNKTIQDALSKSAELRTRNGGEFALFELARDGTWLEKMPVAGLAATKAKDILFYPLKKLDMMSAISVWDASYSSSMAKGLSEKAAVLEADRLVRITQASSLPKDQSFINQRGKIARVLHQFQTFVINDWNLISHDIVRSGLIHANSEDTFRGKFAARAQALTAASFVIMASNLENWISNGFQKQSAGNNASNFASKIPLLGRAIQYQKFGGSTIPVPDALLKGGASAMNLLNPALWGADQKNARTKEEIQLLRSAGTLGGVPFTGQGTKMLSAQRRESMANSKKKSGLGGGGLGSFGAKPKIKKGTKFGNFK